MPSLRGIPVVVDAAPVRSGEKYLTAQGFTAIRDGIKARGTGAPASPQRKPAWLRARAPSGPGYQNVRSLVRRHRLATVCEEAKCPNIGECWNAGTATLMLMGAVCTRACRFCAVDTGNPHGWLDREEPQNAARTVELMQLSYVVLTSVDRDDLPDGGAAHYAACVRAIKDRNPHTAVEALTPDFQGSLGDVETVVDSGIEVFAQNLETVRRLTHPVRDPRAGYEQTLRVLEHAKRHRPAVLTKSSLMLGLGESDAEIEATLTDLRRAGVDIVTLGQYLRPTLRHLPVERFVAPQEFDRYRERALALGFLECVSGPLVRSSYRAEQALERNNAGLDNQALQRAQPAPPPGTGHAAAAPADARAAALPLGEASPAAPRHVPAALTRRLGLVAYEPTWRAMQRFTEERDDATPDEIWFLEHPPVFTLGMNASRSHLIAPGDIPVVQIDRGGQVTYHGPGQLLVYPLVDLRRLGLSIREFVSALERAVIDLAAEFGIAATARRSAPGVYVDGRKLASVGVRVRRGGTYHGLALNVALDLEPFGRINPCGYAGLEMTQLSALGGPAGVAQCADALEPHLRRALRLGS
ncbi:MAG TPA: lipoyl synthase [Steroidobacteraceae bacterium]|nr:lipoyl synthase [Steroidobacteraceae bacterium]